MKTFRFELSRGCDCGHNHRTEYAAIQCGKRLTNRAARGKRFGHPIDSDLLRGREWQAIGPWFVSVWIDGIRQGG